MRERERRENSNGKFFLSYLYVYQQELGFYNTKYERKKLKRALGVSLINLKHNFLGIFLIIDPSVAQSIFELEGGPNIKLFINV